MTCDQFINEFLVQCNTAPSQITVSTRIAARKHYYACLDCYKAMKQNSTKAKEKYEAKYGPPTLEESLYLLLRMAQLKAEEELHEITDPEAR